MLIQDFNTTKKEEIKAIIGSQLHQIHISGGHIEVSNGHFEINGNGRLLLSFYHHPYHLLWTIDFNRKGLFELRGNEILNFSIQKTDELPTKSLIACNTAISIDLKDKEQDTTPLVESIVLYYHKLDQTDHLIKYLSHIIINYSEGKSILIQYSDSPNSYTVHINHSLLLKELNQDVAEFSIITL